VKEILSWLLPPLVGAAIGYVTNAVAIRMLFRPLTEIRLFKGRGKGIRLPFTPGILPRERRKLAASIGAMVERELLTAEILKERLARESVREGIRNAVADLTTGLLERAPGELFRAGNAPPPGLALLAEAAWPRLVDIFTAFLNRPDVHRELETQGKNIINMMMDKLSTFQRFLVEAGNYDLTLQEKMPAIIDDVIRRTETLLRDGSTRERIAAALGKEAAAKRQSIGKLLGWEGEAKNNLDDLITEKLVTTADTQIEKLLATINVKAMVEDRVNSLSMIRVEKIVLDVMASQFKWINLFGGILGALIGFFQALLSHIMLRG
jgi:uncharacterized membrane protein YheB (UPF0754 family)